MTVYFYGCITLDGYLADESNNLDWLYQTGSVKETNYDEFYEKIDVTIMGKKTYDEIAKMGTDHQMYPTTKNYVFTHTNLLPIDGFIPVSGNVVEFVKNIEPSKNIWIVGGNQMLAPLLDNDMVDVMIIQIAPVLLGNGIPLFTQKSDLKRFSLEKLNHYGQFADLEYRKI
ncbi:dihydrofolate reductase family protein [Vagococcus elongatus]|uniref:Diacylglycerol kinase n=1 Tax=Vagococcus elongatus TaxID=180344 RepID=A0A430B5L9_9ENTE|nr:dihydrofolate reductase family protein [Vagococcus elongatus]RSU15582.1 diacylglycerol kinase [Vagococcus elongatus]